MRGIVCILALAAVVAGAAAQAQPAQARSPGGPRSHDPWMDLAALDKPQVEVQHAAARLVVIAEPRRNISITVAHGGSRLPPLAVRREGARIVVDGGLRGLFGGERIDCRGSGGEQWVNVGGYGRVDYADLPVITARAPLDAAVAGQGAVYGQVGPTRSLGIAIMGCGDWTAGPVQGALKVAASGSGDIQAADVGSLMLAVSGSSDLSLGRIAASATVALAGSGGVHAGKVDGPLRARIAGSGDLEVDRINGPVHADIAGSGGVRLHAGYAPEVQVRVSGSGEFTLQGEAGRVDAAASGSGGVRIDHARGPVSQASTGSAEISIGR